MSKAYLDTTVLTDIVLKHNSERGKTAAKALATYASRELPQYAIKEFKKGPLRHAVYLHNKLVATQSVSDTFAALQALSRTPQRYKLSTSLELLVEIERSTERTTNKDLVEKYGSDATAGKIRFDEYRLALRVLVHKAWNRSLKVADIVNPISCYINAKPYDERGLISLNPTACKPTTECCLGPELRSNPEALIAMRAAIERLPSKREHVRRIKSLKNLENKAKMSEKDCDSLGDAILTFLAPADATILTTNLSDFDPLAKALGKTAQSPAARLASLTNAPGNSDDAKE